jgi:plastocyanin
MMPRLYACVFALLSLSRIASAAPEHTEQVYIDNFTFSPAMITVSAGTTVIWMNRDDIPHTVVSSDGKTLKSHALDSDDKYFFTFDTAGEYSYFCSLHPHMQGTVIVK